MASATTRKTCAKCDKGGVTAMCYGCEQAFCTKHFIEHRQELSQQMDNIGQEHDILQRDLTHEQGTHPLLARINQWEQESISKIQTAAESARNDLPQLLSRAKNNLKTSVNKMTEELQSSRDSDDYTELNIKKWTDQLQEFRKMLDSPTTIKIDYENDTRSVVRLIKVSDQPSSSSSHKASKLHEVNSQISRNLETSPSEKFVDSVGEITLSEGGLVATCLEDCIDWSCVAGIGRYSSGVHYIHFRIDKITTQCHIFFGIVNSSENITTDISHLRTRYGWWDLDYFVESGEPTEHNSIKTIEMGDEVTLMLDCDERRIYLKHRRTNRTVDESVNLRQCAVPWKIIVVLHAKDDCVRILH